ncbi:MAG: uroporphyrinogen decarboxylase family protein, partial [Anaerolineae bacterium]|nr:uroporphyrinogen decarboxylase family protein [Anaerolineae bacterium]
VIPSLIAAGIDILEAVQIDATGMDPLRLKSTFGEKLSFHGAVSVQNLLPFADPERIMNTCRCLIDILGKGGGYIAAPTHAIQVGTPVENVMAMLHGILGPEAVEQAKHRAKTERC